DTYMSDYKEVAGVLMPFSLEMRASAQQVGVIAIDSVQVNVELPEASFTMPAPAAEEPAKKDGE
ncbi:MAG: hypothetical protein ABIJ61_05355, partial [bacterium]